MKLVHHGPGVRRVGPYTWRPGWPSVEVDNPEMVVVLLLQPGESFEIADDEPLLQLGMGKDLAGHLALEGIGRLADLAGLSARKAGQLAQAMGLDRDVVKEWVAEGKKLMEADDELRA